MTFSPKNSYNKEEILECAQGNLFGAENGRLPTPNMLMFDRITKITESGGEYGLGEIIAEMDIKKDLLRTQSEPPIFQREKSRGRRQRGRMF